MEAIIGNLAKIPWPILLILSSTGVALGDFYGKYWSINQKGGFYALAMFGYFLSGFFYLPTLLGKGLVITSLIWSILSIIFFLFIGLVIFKETLTTIQIVGVFLGVVSLIVLSL